MNASPAGVSAIFHIGQPRNGFLYNDRNNLVNGYPSFVCNRGDYFEEGGLYYLYRHPDLRWYAVQAPRGSNGVSIVASQEYRFRTVRTDIADIRAAPANLEWQAYNVQTHEWYEEIQHHDVSIPFAG